MLNNSNPLNQNSLSALKLRAVGTRPQSETQQVETWRAIRVKRSRRKIECLDGATSDGGLWCDGKIGSRLMHWTCDDVTHRARGIHNELHLDFDAVWRGHVW
jgi:hypothetical protein